MARVSSVDSFLREMNRRKGDKEGKCREGVQMRLFLLLGNLLYFDENAEAGARVDPRGAME